MFLALEAGQVDSVTLPVPPEIQDRLEDAGEIELEDGGRFAGVFYRINPEEPPLDRPEFRRAVDLAIDRPALVETVLLGQGRPGSPSFMHPDSPWFRPQEATFDPARAEEILDEAGISDTDGDGIREIAGEPVRLSVIVPANAPQQVRTAELIVQQLEEIGVGLEVQSLDPGTLSQRQNAGDFELGSFLGVPHLLGDPDQMIESLDTLLAYPNPEYERLRSEWFETTTIEERREKLVEIQELFVEDPPAFTLYYPDTVYAYNANAYDGWLPVNGHGIHHKWSLVPAAWELLGAEGAVETGQAAPAQETDEGGGTPLYAIVGVGAVAVLALGALGWWLLGRRTGEEEI
jgi:peptide/nickel transport system substrate-binding protein